MALGSILDGFWEGLGGQVGPKINQKSMKKVIDDKMDVGLDF